MLSLEREPWIEKRREFHQATSMSHLPKLKAKDHQQEMAILESFMVPISSSLEVTDIKCHLTTSICLTLEVNSKIKTTCLNEIGKRNIRFEI